MQYVRPGMMVLICAGATGIALAADDKAEEKAEHDIARTVLAKAKIDIAKAIETAQAKIPSGKPIYASTASEDGALLFEVQLVVDGAVTEVTIDAITGEVAKTEPGEGDDPDDLAGSKKVLAVSKTSFAQAIAAAQGKVPGGKPFEVWMDDEDGKFVIGVQFVAGDKIVTVEIDAASGKVLEVEEETE